MEVTNEKITLSKAKEMASKQQLQAIRNNKSTANEVVLIYQGTKYTRKVRKKENGDFMREKWIKCD